MAHSFDFTNAVITGASPVAFVSASAITIHGYVDASANGETPGPGALNSSAAVGFTTFGAGYGGGGGGNATSGGSGTDGTGGGSAQTGFTPMAGGGRGGISNIAYGSGGGGGGGGGAVQLVAADSISISGILDVGGGGGSDGDGGGAGGAILVEAPSVDVDGIVAANGGGGGGGGATCPGADGQANASVAAGGLCSVIAIFVISKPFVQQEDGGGGGTGSAVPTSGIGINGGGGGAAGRIQINTGSGSFTQGADAIVSGTTTTGALSVH